MTGFAFTEVLVALFDAFRAGRMADAERIFDHYLPLIRYENQPKINLTIRKELRYRRGASAALTVRALNCLARRYPGAALPRPWSFLRPNRASCAQLRDNQPYSVS